MGGRGGTGRRDGLKIRFPRECGFDPHRPHQPGIRAKTGSAPAAAVGGPGSEPARDGSADPRSLQERGPLAILEPL